MPNYSRHSVILVRYPFSNLSYSKIRPAVVVSSHQVGQVIIIVPITSRLTGLLPSEFVLTEWRSAGLNVPSAIKRGIYTVEVSLVLKVIGQFAPGDALRLDACLRDWLALPCPRACRSTRYTHATSASTRGVA